MKKNIFAISLLLWLVWPATAQHKPDFSCNPVTLNGHPIDAEFSIGTRGVLALVEGNPRSPKHRSLPFRVSLRRSGTVVRQWSCKNTDESYAVQLDDLMPFVWPGDELVVEPIRVSDGQVKRVIKIKTINWFANLLALDGC